MSTAEATRLPLWKAAVAELDAEGLTDYGRMIPDGRLEELLKAEADTWEFRSELIPMTQYLRTHRGLWLRQKGMNGQGWRFLEREECAACVKAELKAQLKGNRSKLAGLSRVPLEGLTEVQVKTHQMTMWQTAEIILGQDAILRRRTLPAGDNKQPPCKLAGAIEGDTK